ncbi:hypothetical protein QMM42_18105, partial [Leptospira santarosai]
PAQRQSYGEEARILILDIRSSRIVNLLLAHGKNSLCVVDRKWFSKTLNSNVRYVLSFLLARELSHFSTSEISQPELRSPKSYLGKGKSPRSSQRSIVFSLFPKILPNSFGE